MSFDFSKIESDISLQTIKPKIFDVYIKYPKRSCIPENTYIEKECVASNEFLNVIVEHISYYDNDTIAKVHLRFLFIEELYALKNISKRDLDKILLVLLKHSIHYNEEISMYQYYDNNEKLEITDIINGTDKYKYTETVFNALAFKLIEVCSKAIHIIIPQV